MLQSLILGIICSKQAHVCSECLTVPAAATLSEGEIDSGVHPLPLFGHRVLPTSLSVVHHHEQSARGKFKVLLRDSLLRPVSVPQNECPRSTFLHGHRLIVSVPSDGIVSVAIIIDEDVLELAAQQLFDGVLNTEHRLRVRPRMTALSLI